MNHLLLLGIIILQQDVTSFQQQHISANYIKHHATVITRKSTRVNMTKRQSGAPIIQQKQIATSSIFLSAAFGMCLIGGSLMTPQLSNAAAELSSDTTTTTTLPGGGMSITNYARQVFGSPLVGSTPGTSANNKPAQIINPKYTTREERNRAYDEAFQQDARDRDAYYGQMAMRKRQEADESVSQYRESLGLDGKGDTRMRVGEERVEGMASLRDLKAGYLSTDNEDDSSSSSTIPAE